jgi:succinoglycan biosynthesis protein ExoA
VTPAAAAPAATLDVTVVLPVRNEGAHIDGILGDLLAQEFPHDRVEILVVDGQSTDDTRARVEAVAAIDGRVRLLDNPRRLSSAARAIGARAARGRFVAYVDGHCRVESRTLLADMVAIFERTGADCLARPQPLVPTGGGAVAQAIALARTSPFGHSTRSEIFDEGGRDEPRRVSPVSSGAMYRREVFDRVGHFDASFDACEDVEFNTRVEQAGLVSFTSPRLAVRYEPRRTFAALFRQMRRYGLGRGRLHRKHPSSFTIESLIPAAFVLGLLPLAASPWLPRALSIPLMTAYGLYALLAILFAIVAAAKTRIALVPLVALAFPVIHTGLGVGYVRGVLARRRPSAAEIPSEAAESESARIPL